MADTKRKMTPKSAKLPARSLSEALSIAQALSDLAAPSSKALIAGQNGESLGGNFKAKFAAAGYYGIVEKSGDKFALTVRGAKALDGDVSAKRAAVMGTGFGPIIRSFATRQVNNEAIERRLQNDYNATEGSVGNLRVVLVESAEDAELIANDKFDPAGIESVPEVKGSSGSSAPTANQSKPKPETPTSKPEAKPTPKQRPKDREQEAPVPDPPPPLPAPPPQIVVQVDASKMEPAKIAELIQLLRKPN